MPKSPKKRESPKVKGCPRQVRSRANRRNTMDCALLNQMFFEEEAKKQQDKRALQASREAERENKRSSMILPSMNVTQRSRTVSTYGYEDRADSMPSAGIVSALVSPDNPPVNATVPKLIESCNRYMSVTSRPVGCRMSAPPSAFLQAKLGGNVLTEFECKQEQSARKEFHENFANLIKLGSTDKPDSKHEDNTWQTELQDLIWLELQAYHADRTLDDQDKYLFSARQGVGDLLDQIFKYKFQRKFRRDNSAQSSDSGISSDASMFSRENSCNNEANCNNSTHCLGCLSVYCRDCRDQQALAVREVEELLTRLEVAESLFPSTRAMGLFFPMYRSEAFVGRVKAMCLWYNMTQHHRWKLVTLGKLLARLQGKKFPWPIHGGDHTTDSSSSSAPDTAEEIPPRDVLDCKIPVRPIPRVQFNIDGDLESSPNESASSLDSSRETIETEPTPATPEVIGYGRYVNEDNFINMESLARATYRTTNQSTAVYRKYIETVLKSRGLNKSLSFLHRLHNVVLRKAQLALEKPGAEDGDESEPESFDDDVPDIEPPLEREQEIDLRRFGVWSPEARSLGLPSYVQLFIFLSLIPLQVIHEFLRMRLETKPDRPNPLSLEQLMKELREGLTLAMTHRERFSKHINTALVDREQELETYSLILDEFDVTVKSVLSLYLEYVELWILKAAPAPHQKTALYKEWAFTRIICPMIPGQHVVGAKQFCHILGSLFKSIGDTLVSRASELDAQISNSKESKKSDLLTVCRQTQALLTAEREKSLRVMGFAKLFCKDIDGADFHRDHSEEFSQRLPCEGIDRVCPEVVAGVKQLHHDVLDVRSRLIMIIERTQERCCIKNMVGLDELDKMAVLSRAREILHQAYKFGFEYHKEIAKLFDTNITSCRDDICEMNLSMGIINFAKMWMEFVTNRCERGRGVRPRWAAQGLDFLISACDPQNTKHLSEQKFEELKSRMDLCISHVIGISSEPEKKRASPRSRKITPRARTPTRASLSPNVMLNSNQKSFSPQTSLKEESDFSTEPNSPEPSRREQIVAENLQISVNHLLQVPPSGFHPAQRQIRTRDSINRLDMDLETKMRERNLIGQVKALNMCDKVHIRARSVNFRWHRGIKIGQGRFGKVYTAVNNSSGELMAMKEITIQPGETRAIKKVAEELKIFEGISHKHLVKYFGVEIHREELLIFMELCSEGTLESLIELSGSLHEGLTRRFSVQLLSAVYELHKHGIVHRDIKTANIFLTSAAKSLKLGDFGSAVKIQAHTTVPGELQGYVGTQAYMAPEVFTKNNSDGHGRASDIWSLGCVVIEMASGKRPWAQFDSNFQIMFKVGMGEAPEVPASLSQEGHDFLDHCMQHDPANRWTASDLLGHHFCKVLLDDDCKSCDDKELRRSFKKTKSTSSNA